MSRLENAQADIVSMLEECGLSQVIISVDGKHNRYAKRGCNVYYAFASLSDLQSIRPEPKIKQASIFGD